MVRKNTKAPAGTNKGVIFARIEYPIQQISGKTYIFLHCFFPSCCHDGIQLFFSLPCKSKLGHKTEKKHQSDLHNNLPFIRPQTVPEDRYLYGTLIPLFSHNNAASLTVYICYVLEVVEILGF